MNYGDILSRAWQITWNHKILWIFGILAALGSGGGGGGGVGGDLRANTRGLPPDIQRQFERPEVTLFVLCIVLVAIIIALVLFVLSIIGRGGLIGGIRAAEDRGSVSFEEAWSIGVHYFWRMLGIVLLTILPVLVIALFGLFTSVVAALTFGLGALCLLPLLCLLILALIPLGILAHFAQFAVVLEDLGVVDAFRRSWEVLKANLGPIIIVGLILIVIGFIAGLILVAPFFAIVFPTLFFAFLGRDGVSVPVIALGGAAILCYLPIAIVLSGILQTWTTSVWTLAYRQFVGNIPTVSAPVPTPI